MGGQSTSQHHPQVLKAMPSSSSFKYLSSTHQPFYQQSTPLSLSLSLSLFIAGLCPPKEDSSQSHLSITQSFSLIPVYETPHSLSYCLPIYLPSQTSANSLPSVPPWALLPFHSLHPSIITWGFCHGIGSGTFRTSQLQGTTNLH